jgi:mRNA-decapping enzyme subunit 2
MSLRSFCLRIFQHCPLLASFSVENHMKAFEEILQYKTRVPVRGAILLNEAMDSTLLVKGWKKGASWSFPRGKINKDEDDLECAIREVDEETGFDIKAAGLVPRHDEVKYIEITMREQQIRLYVFRNVPMDTVFQPRTRKEISKIQWYKLSELPAFRKKGSNQEDDVAAASNANKFYMVAPFLVPLKKWVLQQKKKDAARASSYSHLSAHPLPEEPLTEEETGTQTDAAAGPSASTPAIETFEGATRELQRLLKVQPPTQGLQIGAPEPEAAVVDKGEALMAMLQSKKSLAYQAAAAGNSQIPHTPLDHIQQDIPEPHSPHHHHPTQRLPQNYYQQPPPNFPIVQHGTHNVHPTYHNFAAPSHAHPNYYNHAQAYNQNLPQVASARPPRKEPVLVHPQPLPPQVQQSLLTRGILPTPQLQEMAGMTTGGNAAGPVSYNTQPSNFNQGRGPAQQRPVNMQPPQMTSHTMSLLNAFKSGTRRTSEPQQAPVSNGQNQGSNVANMVSQKQYQQDAAPALDATGAQWSGAQQDAVRQYGLPKPPSISAMPNLYSQLDGAVRSAPQNASLPAQSIQHPQPDSHRSALLDMFKKQGTLSPTSSSDATVRPGESDQERTGRATDISKPSAQLQSSADAMAAVTLPNGGPVMNPELNLPFRALQILSRPKPAEIALSERKQVQYPQAPLPPAHMDSKHSATPLTALNNQTGPVPQVGNARSHADIRATEPSSQTINAPYNLRQYPGAFNSPNAASFQAASLPNNRQENNTEQRQKLLSLFSKPQPSPTAVSSAEKGKMKETQADQPRSQVASLASASGEGMQAAPSTSRRGSGTPISPSDRDFLLNYLQSVSQQAI